jgi:hypothetical protein
MKIDKRLKRMRCMPRTPSRTGVDMNATAFTGEHAVALINELVAASRRLPEVRDYGQCSV